MSAKDTFAFLAFLCACVAACSRAPAPAAIAFDAGAPEQSPSETANAPPLAALSASEAPSRGPATPHTHAASSCSGTLVPVVEVAGTLPKCVLACESDASCPEGLACAGHAPLWENGKNGKSIGFCAVGPRGLGKAHAGAIVDAGVAPAAKHLDVRKNAAGVCPAGYGACGAACRLECKASAECGLLTAHCLAGFCQGPGALPCK